MPIFVGAMAFAVKAVIEKVAVDGGLAEGDTVVVEGLQRVRPGVVVAPSPAGGAPVAKPAG